MDLNEKLLYIINLLMEPKTVATVKQLSDYSRISENAAIGFIDEYHQILSYENRFRKYGMDNDLIQQSKLKIINSLLPNNIERKKVMVYK